MDLFSNSRFLLLTEIRKRVRLRIDLLIRGEILFKIRNVMRVQHFEVITRFRLDEGIVLTAGPHIKRLQNTLGARLQILNVPREAPPDVPRIIATMQNSQIQICLDRYKIAIKPPENINKNLNSAVDFMSNLVEKVLPSIIFENFNYELTGLISFFEFPSSEKGRNSRELLIPIFDRLINLTRDERPLASFQLQFGLQEKDYFKTFTISGYDSFNIPIPVMPGRQGYQRIRIPVSKENITESGINLVWDINNTPSNSRLGALEDFRSIINEIRVSYSTLLASLNLEGLVSW